MKTEFVKYDLPKIVGRGYATFWNFKGRYRVVKGSRRSKKSKTMALWTVYNILKYPDSNMLVVRKTYRTLKDSCFTELKWAINRLGVEKWWDIKESPIEMTYKPTGQKIYFRGLDDPLKITSIATSVGVLSWMWIEEAYEIQSEEDFDTLTESMLGDCPDGLFKQVTLTFNPWNEKTWIKKRFFDEKNDDILAITTNYKCNEWLSEEDIKIFEKMREKNPKRYAVAGLGQWGITQGLIYENYTEKEFELESIRDFRTVCGLDFGYTNDPTAFFIGFYDEENCRLFIWDEIYEKGLSNKEIYNRILSKGYAKERICADSAEPKSIDELKGRGLKIYPAQKGRDSILNGIQFLQSLEITVHPRCINFLTEISSYCWSKDKFGNDTNTPCDFFNHLMDAMRYGCENLNKRKKWMF